MECSFQLHKLCGFKVQRWLFVVVLVAVTHLLFQSFLLPYGNALRSLLPDNDVPKIVRSEILDVRSPTKFVMVLNPLTVNASDLVDSSSTVMLGKEAEILNVGGELRNDIEIKEKGEYKEMSFALKHKEVNTSEHFVSGYVDKGSLMKKAVDKDESSELESIEERENGFTLEEVNNNRDDFPVKRIVEPSIEITTENIIEENVSLSENKSDGGSSTPFLPSPLAASEAASVNETSPKTLTFQESSFIKSVSEQSDLVTSKNLPATVTIPGKKKMRCNMPPKSVTTFDEMNHILARHRRSSRAMRPRRSSVRDGEIVAVKQQIEHASLVANDQELYAPLFRNVSMFKKSYGLMERTLKIYVYKDGDKPIFHQPILKGLYASEGWFMKLMEGNRHYVVKDPRRAHLFYMPFSSRMLEYSLYVRNSHNRTNLRQHLKDYAEKIAAKYPYWNRTGGADHFLVACHDWAPYETRHHMEHCIKALCNADVTAGFKIGRDVSLPETYVRSARNPLRDLGGKPPSQRKILAFYAGNIHGYLRPILLKHWKDKDPDMKIFGPMPPGVESKMNYIQHMKSSKYCICPKGYEVNSPRVVEAFFYECVPVIISDNFVPPFFDVLNWEAFSVVVAEKDIPNLKEILLSIPKEKYLEMQLAVRKVQKHFLWHAKPTKYDLFHMTLHSIWYNRVFQIKPR
ncbi:hypothetical protein UlMin_022195 [Ulmus minor]